MSAESSHRELSNQALNEIANIAGQKYKVPFWSLAVGNNEDILACCDGFADYSSNRTLTTETPIQIGSITKNLTALMVLKLVEEGKVSLDDSIQEHLLELQLPKIRNYEKITIRHLLNHTSGIDGDLLISTGTDTDALKKYVQKCSELEAFSDPGQLFSYCNAAFPILARLTESLLNDDWYSIVKKQIVLPLNLKNFGSFEELGKERVAYSHSLNENSNWSVIQPDYQAHCLAPAGGTLYATPTDLVRYGQTLLPTKTSLITETTLKSMTNKEVEGPCFTFANAWGLGTQLFDWLPSEQVYGHDGANQTTQSFLKVFPDSNLVICLMVGGGDALAFQRYFFDQVLNQFFDANLPSVIPNTSLDIDLNKYCGSYSSSTYKVIISATETNLLLEFIPNNSRDFATGFELTLITVSDEYFASQASNSSELVLQKFLQFDHDGVPQLLHFRGRNYKRVSSTS